MKKLNTIKKILLTIFIVVSIVTNIFAFDGLEYFSGKSGNGYILLEWKIDSANEIESFYIMKKRIADTDYKSIHRINSVGNSTEYYYKDESLYKTSDLNFEYKLKIVFIDQSIEYSEPIEINMNISSVNQTWGSIKAMFR